jgi:hypothetical protein
MDAPEWAIIDAMALTEVEEEEAAEDARRT